MSITFLSQLAVLLLNLGGTWLLQFILRRPLTMLDRRVKRSGWPHQVLAVTERLLHPLLAWGVHLGVMNLFWAWGLDVQLLQSATPLFAVWLVYQAITALLFANLSSRQARLWSRHVLLPIFILVGILNAFGFLDEFLALSPPAVEGLENITIGSTVAGLLTLALFLLLSRLSWRFLEFNFLPEAGANAALAHATATLLAYVIIILGAIVALGMAGVNFTTVTVIVGGLSIGLGFGLQQIASNFVSGFILMFERSIGRGDVIEVSGQMGVVQNVGIRSIIIRTHTNREIIIPNAYFLSDMMTNLTRSDRAIRVDIEVGVTYQANPLEVEQALLEAAQHPSILEDPPPAVQFRDFGDSSLDFALLAWTDDPMGIPKLASELHYQVWDALQSRNIEIPYPQRDIHIRTGKSRI